MALTLVAFPAVLCAQIAEAGEANGQPTPEIKKSFEAFAGDWDTSENREQTQFFLNGGERKGRSHIRLGAGGAVPVMEVHDYEEVVDGKKLRFRDTFQDITANSHTLVFAWIQDDGSMEPVIISKAVRRSKH
jgi:hypothetical protein